MSNGSTGNYLTSGHLDLLRKAQKDLHDMIPLMDMAESCGVDCELYRQGHAYATERIAKFINTFFPDHLQPPTAAGSYDEPT